MTVAVDMTNEATRTNVILMTVEHGLAIEIRTGMKVSRGRSPLTVARDNGWTHKQTKKGALLDVIAMRRILDERYSPSDRVNHIFPGNEQKKVTKALKVADAFRTRLDALGPDDEPLDWYGIK